MPRGRYPARIYTPPPARDIEQRYLRRFDNRDFASRAPVALALLNEWFQFANAAPMELDIGCGNGEFICARAARHSERFFVGIERSMKPLCRAIDLASQLDLKNIHFVKADARILFPLMPPASLSAVHYHFPPPIVKVRHRRTGVFSTPLLDMLERSLRPDGFAGVLLDSHDSGRIMMDRVAERPSLTLRTTPPFSVPDEELTASFYFRKWRDQGRALLRFEVVTRR